jgi:hypothetical protein
MRVLVACEFSGIVRAAFRARGHDAISCDLLPAEDGSPHHYQGDAFGILDAGWDMLIAHPACTYLCNSGVRWLYEKPDRWGLMEEAAGDFRAFLNCRRIPRRVVENPVMHKHAARIVGRRADQFVQPWWFGHPEIKATGFHLEGLPPLKPTRVVSGRTPRVHHASPGPDRWKDRSRFLPGIAEAMATQWG